jgi:hypothetical protein
MMLSGVARVLGARDDSSMPPTLTEIIGLKLKKLQLFVGFTLNLNII